MAKNIKETFNHKKAAEIASASKVLNKDKNKINDKVDWDKVKNSKVDESNARKQFKAEMDDSKRQLASDWYGKPDPYDNRTSAEKASKKDVLTLSNASYGNSLLEKLVANSSHVEYQNAVLKFQEKQVELLTTIANSVTSIGKVIVTSEASNMAGESPDYQRNVSKMAKALGSGDWATAAGEGMASMMKKVDKNGFIQLAQSMFSLFKDMVEGDKIKEMFKDKVKNTTLDILPFGLGDFFRDIEKDAIGGFQKKFNQGSVSERLLYRVFAKDFAAFNPITFKNQKLKVDYTEKAIFTKKTDKAITEIIPEYLAEILATLRNDEARLYDYNEDKYIGRTELAFREQKANNDKHWKHAMNAGHNDFKDIASDVFDAYGKYNKRVREANAALFDGKGANGKLKFKDEKAFGNLMKRLFEVFGSDTKDILTTPNLSVATVMNKLYGSDYATIRMYTPILVGLHNIMSLAAQDPEKYIDIEDFYYQIQEWYENNVEGRNAQTQRFSGEGSINGGKTFEKGLRDFANKFDIIGENNAAAWGALKKMSMGNNKTLNRGGNGISNAINSENTFINTNVVYINASEIIANTSKLGELNKTRGKRRKGAVAPSFNFPNFNIPRFNFGGGGNDDPAAEFKDLMREAERHGDPQSRDYGDQVNYYAGAAVGGHVAEGEFGNAADQEEYTALQYKKYAHMMSDSRSSGFLSNAWNELGPDSTQEEIENTLKARKIMNKRKPKWDAALQLYAVFDHAGMTRDSYERVHGRGSGNDRIPNPMWFLSCIDANGNLNEERMIAKAAGSNPPINFGGLDDATYYVEKRKEMQANIKGDVKGSGTEAIFNMIGLVYKDPKFKKVAGPGVATMAGLALGAIAKEKGIIKSNKGLGAVVALSNMFGMIPSVKRNMEMMFGEEADIKDSSGHTNRQKALAKILDKVAPLTGAGLGAVGWVKLMSKMGPAGMALGIIGSPIAALAGASLAKGMQGAMGQWLFGKKDKDAGWFDKTGKFIGGLLPSKLKKLVTGGINDQKEWEVYAESLTEMRPTFEAAVRERHAGAPSVISNTMQEYDRIIQNLNQLPDEEEKAPMANEAFGRLRDQANRLLRDHGSEQMINNLDSEYAQRMKDKELRINDKVDLSKADYTHADDSALLARYMQAKENGEIEDGVEFEQYSESLLEAARGQISERDWDQRGDQIGEDMQRFFKEAEIDAADLEVAIDAYMKYIDTPFDDIEAKSNAYHAAVTAFSNLDPNAISMIFNSGGQQAAILQAEMMNYVGGLLGTANERAIKAFIARDEELSKIFESGAGNAKSGFLGMFGPLTQKGKEALRGKQSALEHADILFEMLNMFNDNLGADALRYRTTTTYNSTANNYHGGTTSQTVGDDVFNRFRNFLRDAMPDAEFAPRPQNDNTTTQDGNADDDLSFTEAGMGFSTSIKDRNIPKELLSILGFASKSKWGMDDFSKTTIGGRSGSAVGCSVATMNNILHFLGLPEISTNTLAAIANLHTNSTGVKFSFFKHICNRMGLAFAVYNSNKNRFNHNFFKAWSGAKDKAYAVLLNNYNGSGHFVFCANYKDGKLTMIDPIGKGREEKISVNDIAVRASIIITITKIADQSPDRNFGSFGTGYTDAGDDYDERDIDEDDGIISGTGVDTRSKLYGNRGPSKREPAPKTTKQRLFGNRGYSAGTAAVLDKLTSVQSTIAAAAIVNANDKQQAKKIQSTLNKIDPDTKADASALSNLTNSPEVVKGQAEENKAEEALERTAKATEVMAGKKDGEDPKHAYRKYAKQAGAGILSMIGGLPKLLGSLALAGAGIFAGWKGLKFGGNLIKTGWNRFKHFTVDNMMEESRDQQVDPTTGEVIDNGHFKDVSTAIQGGRDMMRYGRAGAFLAKGSAGFLLKSANFGANALAKFGDKAANIPLVGKLIKSVLGLPLKLCDWILKSKLGQWLQEKGLTKTLEWFRGKLTKLLEKIAPKLSKKITEQGAKKGAGSIFKRLPGIGLTILLVQAFYAAYQGYKHAGQLIKVDEDKVSTSLRVKVMFAKLMYDVGPELLCAILKLTPGGFAGFALDVAIIVLKEMITWDVLVDALGIGEELRTGKTEDQKNAAEAGKITAGINKEEKDEKYDAASKEKKEADAANKARSMGLQDGSEYGGLNSAANRNTANGGAYNGYGGGSDRSSTYGGFGGSSSSSGGYSSDTGYYSGGSTTNTITTGTGEKVSFSFDSSMFKKGDMKGNWDKIKHMFVAVSKSTGIPVELLTMIAGQESGFDPNASSNTSSAKGLFQLINSTWAKQVPKLKSLYGIENPNVLNPLHNALAIALYMKENISTYKDAVARAGKPMDGAAIYAGNFFGGGGAKALFNALANTPNAPMSSVMPANVMAANDWLYKHTPASLYSWLQHKMDPVNNKKTAKYVQEALSLAGSSLSSSTTTVSSDAAKVKNPAGLLEADIATPSGKSGYTGTNTKAPKGATDSDIPTSSGKSAYTGKTATQASSSGSDRGGSASSSYGTVAKSPSVQVTNNTISSSDGLANAIAKMSTVQTASIVTALNNLATLLQNILKELSNNNTEAMRQAAAGAK